MKNEYNHKYKTLSCHQCGQELMFENQAHGYCNGNNKHIWKFVEKKSVAMANLGNWECNCGAKKEGYQIWLQEPQEYN